MSNANQRPRPAVLIVCDGLGVAPDGEGNAVTRAKTPNIDSFIKRYPTMTLRASGETVGLMWGEMGNSQVGHLTIGAGRVYYQSLPRIERDIESRAFYENEAILSALKHVKQTKGTLHVMGIMSSGNVHGANRHCYEILRMAKKKRLKRVAVHPILDGRDTLYNSGLEFVSELITQMDDIGIGEIATLSGRYYAMDRDTRWDRTQRAYRAIALGESAVVAEDPIEAIKASYAKEVYDEQFLPTVMTKRGKPIATVNEGDVVIFFNFRPDRARQITKAFVMPGFDAFDRAYMKNVPFITMTEYETGLPVTVAYPPVFLENTLAEVISKAGMTQLHIAETEKYAHVTFFLNGAHEKPFPAEDRKIIPSPNVANYDEQPEMSAREMTAEVVRQIETDNYDFIAINFANPDMVAHTGNYEATLEAMKVTDECLGTIVKKTLEKNGVVFITADHGNAEEVMNVQTGERDKEHSTNPVPFWVIANHLEGRPGLSGDVPNGDLSMLPPVGMLADIAPTILESMGIKKPPQMTGTSLL
ncbi:MAG: 2,3-bisphosphoglycerate-independent phosphoglycerate mutase [bacterium]|nr:2,3-bisphosphoglycerate-independent phosphoglycerate mutase [bacterium]MDA1024463.1 2,3-bisphosphoglycerate-independent phosphoglycerate mutase [bacterium]